MVPKDFRKPQCVTAGWVTLLVAVVWEVASIYIIGVYNCAWNFIGVDSSGISTWNMLYITYFMGGCKTETDALSIGFTLTPPTSPAENLQIWLWILSLVTLAWIPSCVLLIVAASSVVRGKLGAALYYPWICVTATLVVLDLAGSVYHFVDVFSTTTADDYASFTYNTTWSSLTSSSSDGITTWLPSLYITLFFWRFFILWLFNIYFVYIVYKGSSAVAVYNHKHLQQTTLMTADKSKSWRDKFRKGPDPRELPQQSVSTIFMPPLGVNTDLRLETQERSPPTFVPSEMQLERRLSESSLSSSGSSIEHYPVRYEVDQFGIPIKEIRVRDPREISYNPSEGHLPRSPLPSTSQVFDFPDQPRSRIQSNSERWQESAPPIAGGVEVPPELNKNRPFSYMAGDQPQFMRKPLSRSNSKSSEYPMIPRPDYTIAQRHSGSLEYVPYRFKVPSPKRSLQSTSSFNYDSPSTSTSPHSPTSPTRRASVPHKKQQFFPKVSRAPSEDISTLPQAKYVPPQDIPSQQQAYHTNRPAQNTDYNINKMY